jgi:hypothetical protein
MSYLRSLYLFVGGIMSYLHDMSPPTNKYKERKYDMSPPTNNYKERK